MEIDALRPQYGGWSFAGEDMFHLLPCVFQYLFFIGFELFDRLSVNRVLEFLFGGVVCFLIVLLRSCH